MPRSQPKTDRLKEALRLRKLREHLDVSQRDLAHEFQVAHTAISSWESGIRTIPGPVLKLMEIYENEAGMENPTQDSAAHEPKPKDSWLSRNLQLSIAVAGLTARFAGQFLLKWVGLKPNQKKGTEKLVETLGSLKGLMMKAGQMLAYIHVGQTDSLRTPFLALLSKAKPLSSDGIENVFSQEFGRKPHELFHHWNPNPIGVGSIGQVHEAELPDGSPVAVKVQYPLILKTLEADLNYTRFIDLLGTLFFKDQDRDSFVNELTLQAARECDYFSEMSDQETLRRAFQGDSQIQIPKVFLPQSSGRIIVQEKLTGISFPEFLDRATPQDKNQAGETLFRFAYTSLFRSHLLNCDPHPGNYAFQEGSVIFYDFGCMKTLHPEWVSRFKRLLNALLQEDRTTVNSIVIDMGYVPRPNHFDFNHHFDLLKLLYAPILTEGSFQFNRSYVESVWNRIILKNDNRSKSSVPADWIFVNRLQWGLYSVLAELNAKANWNQIIRSLI